MERETVDLVAKFMEYYLMVNTNASSLVEKCNIDVFLANDADQEFSFTINSFGTGKVPDKVLEHIIRNSFNFNVVSVLYDLNLIKPKESDKLSDIEKNEKEEDKPWENPDKAYMLISKVLCMFKSRDEWFQNLKLDTLDNVPDFILLNYVMERPGHPGVYGYMFHGNILNEHEDGPAIFTKLIQRIGAIPKDEIKKSIDERRERIRLLTISTQQDKADC